MAYLSIINGVKGLWFYTGSGQKDFDGKPAGIFNKPEEGHWAYVQTLTRELREFSPVIMAEAAKEKIEMNPHDAPVEFTTRELQGKKYLIAANKSAHPQSVTFSSELLKGKQPRIIFENGEKPETTNGVSKVSFVPFGVHIIRVDYSDRLSRRGIYSGDVDRLNFGRVYATFWGMLVDCRVQRFYAALLFISALFCADRAMAQVEHCTICKAVLAGKIYLLPDNVSGEKVQICADCLKLTSVCFMCGLPVKENYKELPDGRFLCARDVKNAVIDDDEARQTVLDVQDTLDRLLSRFITFPSAKLETAVVDRINLMALFALPGHDYECPNVLGYTQPKTNANGSTAYKVSVLSGLSRGQLRATCAHELTHAWVFENVSPARRKTLGSDGHEGFCELVAYLLMDSQGYEDAKKQILLNHYTRGQINLFIEAEHRFGFNEVVEWVKNGQDALLHGDDLNRIRDLRVASRKSVPGKVSPRTAAPAYVQRPAAVATDFVLKGVSWSPSRPMAVINDRTFEMNEQGHVQIQRHQRPDTLRVAIRQDGVRLRVVGSGEETGASLGGEEVAQVEAGPRSC